MLRYQQETQTVTLTSFGKFPLTSQCDADSASLPLKSECVSVMAPGTVANSRASAARNETSAPTGNRKQHFFKLILMHRAAG